ncbi:unnamed protein product [Cylicocyclus nassatus]|uniref:Defective in germ line development protein 3-like KH5 domain-containing protein n=1 Tax=Cylicocyclus nassatus TaxID=53992 RepID=A0AA36HBD0_CYLNA|nr:unnamed protein product [Cylicocyclus nassatus]
MREGAVREGDGYHAIARYPFRAAIPQTRSLSPLLQSKAMVAPTITDVWNGNRFPDLSIRPSLHQILEQPEQFFHISQQSTKMSIDHSRRVHLSKELKRRADILHYRDYLLRPSNLQQAGKKVIAQEAVDIEKVTLTMEITYSDYEEMFTKRILGGTSESCANIMMETNTIIQFPDRDEANPDFMHQVTITGHLTDVEEARIRLRRFCPVVLMFAVSERARDDVPANRLGQWIKEKIDDGLINFPTLSIQVLPHSLSSAFKDPVVRVSGRVGDERLLLQACERLRDLIFVPEVAEKVSFSTHMEVPAAQRSQLVGTPDGAQLLVISRVTKALLHFPSHSDEASQTLFFYFTGQPESILRARRYVQGLLPMQLCFHAGSEDLRARIDPENRLIKFYDEVLRVSVRVVPSDLESLSLLPGDQMRHFISLRSSEYNVGALYAVMRRVLKRGDDIPMVKPTDYAEMLPLIPDLIKHACEVNVKCRLEPSIFDVTSLSPLLAPTILLHPANSSLSLSTEAADQSLDGDFLASSENAMLSQCREPFAPFSRSCLDNSFDTTSSAHSSRNENEVVTRGGAAAVSRSRHSSPKHYFSNKHFGRHSGSEKESFSREKGSYITYSRRNYHGEGRGASFRGSRFAAPNPSHPSMKHHLALRSRDGEASRGDDNRYQRSELELDDFGHRKELQLHHVAERLGHSASDRRTASDWRGSQQLKSSPGYSISSKTVLARNQDMPNRRQMASKIELQHRIKEEAVDDDKENTHHTSSRRMDVMDLIKLASAEDFGRKKSIIEESSCLLDCGDTSGADTVAVRAVQDVDDPKSTVVPDSHHSDATHTKASSTLSLKSYNHHPSSLPAADSRIITQPPC